MERNGEERRTPSRNASAFFTSLVHFTPNLSKGSPGATAPERWTKIRYKSPPLAGMRSFIVPPFERFYSNFSSDKIPYFLGGFWFVAPLLSLSWPAWLCTTQRNALQEHERPTQAGASASAWQKEQASPASPKVAGMEYFDEKGDTNLRENQCRIVFTMLL